MEFKCQRQVERQLDETPFLLIIRNHTNIDSENHERCLKRGFDGKILSENHERGNLDLENHERS